MIVRALDPLFVMLASVSVYSAECSFRANPNAFLEREARGIRQVYDRTVQWDQARGAKASSKSAKAASDLPPRNFIDEEIFGKLREMNVPSAAMSTDEEFLRRITLDLTGKLPTPAEIRAFAANDNPNKRDELIDKLIPN